MTVAIVGVSHKTAPIAVRERLALPVAEVPGFLAELRACPSVTGAVALATCNRAEVLASLTSPEGAQEIALALARRHGLAPEDVTPYLYVLEGPSAVLHAFRVAASLDSMIVGEPQILGQFKQALALAREAGAVDSELLALCTAAIAAAKRARTESGVGENAVSIPYAAVELARKIHGDLSGLHVMLIGAGKMGVLTSRHLAAAGPQRILVANRTFERAVAMAETLHATPLRLEEIGAHLGECDVVICSAEAPGFVLTRELVDAARRHKRRRPLFVIDIAVPRNADPALADLQDVYLYNVDDLAEVADANRRERSRRAVTAEEIVRRGAETYLAGVRGREAVPTIVSLRQRMETIRHDELERFRGRLAALTPEQYDAVEQLTLAIVSKILHHPLTQLRRSSERDEASPETIKTIRRLFGLS